MNDKEMREAAVARSLYWPQPSAHREYWERFNNPLVYEYDPTDDGPEVIIIRTEMLNQIDEFVEGLNAL